jgi:hypothetical protein
MNTLEHQLAEKLYPIEVNECEDSVFDTCVKIKVKNLQYASFRSDKSEDDSDMVEFKKRNIGRANDFRLSMVRENYPSKFKMRMKLLSLKISELLTKIKK